VAQKIDKRKIATPKIDTLLAGLVGICVLLGGLRSAEAQLSVEPAGPEQAVFLHDRDACRPEGIPDAPARAFRDADGRTHLFATHYINFGFVGRDLNSVKRDCRVVYQGGGDDNPAFFNDRGWLTSFWTNDGRTVEALVHNEFQANLRPWLCPSRIYFECWYNAITAAQSTDGGFTFARQTGAVVAAPAYRFDASVRHPVGYFSPSNIVTLRDFLYTMVWAADIGEQKLGVCLLRTNKPDDPETWRAWDGSGFNVRLGNPYREPPGAPAQFCALIDPANLRDHIESLVRHQPSERYIAVMGFGGPRPGFYTSDSTDLFHWSEPRKIMDTGPVVPGECDDRSVLAYPSLIDASSTSRNFETVGDTAYLYYTRLHFRGCAGNLDRDLMRVPVAIKPLF
jgi:hypothetical protein